MKKSASVNPFDSCLNDELQISSKHALHYEVDGINLDDEQAVAKLRKKAEKKLDDAARAAITDYWSTLQVLLEDEMDEIQLYHLNNLKGELCYYLIEIPFGNARAWDVNTMKAVAASIQHKPDNPDKKSTIPDAIQRALIISNGSKEICFADLDQDYSHNQTESFLSLTKKLEHHIQQKDWSQENRKEIQQAFTTLSPEEKNDFLNLITRTIENNMLAFEDHPLFKTGKKFPKTSTQKSVKSKSTKTSDKSVRDPNDKRPATMEEWRAMFPDKSSQETIDQILKGLTSGVGKDTSVNHAKFKRDTGISQKKQPQDLYQWLLACKTLYLSNVTQFDDVILHDLRPVSVFTQLTSLNVCISPVTDPDCLRTLTQLKALSVNGGIANDWHFLESLSELESLKLWPLEPTDQSPRPMLKACSKLKTLDWSGTFSDISVLSSCQSLVELELRSGALVDVAPLRDLLNLEELNVSWCGSIRDIKSIFGLVNLSELNISENQVSDISGIENLKNLSIFEAEHNCISDFKPYLLLEDNPTRAEEWINETASTQIPVDNPTGQALYQDWNNLAKWTAHADYLETKNHPVATQIKQRLANERSSLPWTWARDLNIKRDEWQ